MASIALTATGLYNYNPYKEVVSALIWGITPRLVNILTSKPTGSTSKIDRIREKIFGIRTQFLEFTQTNRLTKCTWFILNDILIANMGFATLFVLMNHFINPSTNASSSGVLAFKLLMCIPIAGFRGDLCKENKDWSREALPTEKAWELAQGDFDDIRGIINGKLATDFRRIPCIFFDRKEFQRRKCAITNRPIREVFVIRETPTSSPTYYEYNNLINWRSQEEETLPPNWPESMPFNRDTIVIDQVETAQITGKLQRIVSRYDVKNQARKCLPQLEEKLRKELCKHIDSLRLPGQSPSLFKQIVRGSRPVYQLIDMIKLIENTLENISQKRLGEIITANIANRLMLLGFTTIEIKKLLINPDDSLALFNLKSSELSLYCYNLVLQIFKGSETQEERTALSNIIRVAESTTLPAKDEQQLQTLESQIREAFYSRISAEPSQASRETDMMTRSYLNYLRAHQNYEQEDPRQLLSLVKLSIIPPFLHNDAVLKKHVCAITLDPIRDPVQDPTAEPCEKPILYERTAIKNWLELRGKSPATQKELTLNMLIPKPDIKCIIDIRLRFHQRNMDTYLAESPSLAQNLTNSNIPTN